MLSWDKLVGTYCLISESRDYNFTRHNNQQCTPDGLRCGEVPVVENIILFACRTFNKQLWIVSPALIKIIVVVQRSHN